MDILVPGDGVSDGGSGTWNAAVTNWDAGNGSNHVAWGVGGNVHVANFGGAGGTVSFGSDLGALGAYPNALNVTAGNYVFDQGGFDLSWRGTGLNVANATLVLTNGTVTLLNAGVTVTGTNALRIYSKVSSDGVVGITKFGGGELYLLNDANDFTGTLLGQNGLGIYFTSIRNSGVASAAGAGGALITGLNNVMNYIGTGDSSDRQFIVFGPGNDTFNSSGTGALNWTGPFDNTKSGSSTLVFGGSNSGNNAFRADLTNSVLGSLSVAKADAGTWVLSGTNTYSGATTVNGGTLIMSGGGTLTNTTTINAGRLVLTDGIWTGMNQVVVTGTGGSSLILTNGAHLFTVNGFAMNAFGNAINGTIALYANSVWSMGGLSINPGNQISGTSNRFLVADGAIVTNSSGVGNVLAVIGSHNTMDIVNGGKVYWQNGGIFFGQGAARNNRIHIGGIGAPAYMQNLGGMQIPQNGGSIANYGVIVSNGVWDAGAVFLGRSASTGNYIHVLADGVINLNGNTLSIADSGAGISNYLRVAGGLVTNLIQLSINSNNQLYVDAGTIAAGADGTLLTGAGDAYIREGGVTIDTVAFTTTIAMGLNEDPASTGGGLTKRGDGTLTLFAVNTYSGDTTIDAGTLALVAPGSINNSPLITVAAGASFDAGAGFTLGAGQTLAGDGTVVAAIEVDGAVSPGVGGIGTLTADNTVTWNAGAAWPYDLGTASTSDRLSINGDFAMGIGGEGEFTFDLQHSGVAGVYTLVTWTASTTFDDGTEFSAVNVPGGMSPSFTLNANALLLTLSSSGGGFSAGSTNTSIALVSGQVTFGFTIASGAVYHVQASTNLLSAIDNGFTDIAGPLTNPGAATIMYTNISPDPMRLFRIKSP